MDERRIVQQSPSGAGEQAAVFGLSLSKVLLTILIGVALWRGFALIGRLARERQVQAVRDRSGRSAKARPPGTIELVECARCGAYFDPQRGCRCGYRQA
jgi:hypothetical protein